MKFKKTGAEKTTITRDLNKFIEKTDNIFKAVSIMAKRSAQVNVDMKEELMEKLEEKYSGYMIFKNKGYGTKEHLSFINKNGMTNLHRKSFLKNQILFNSHQSKKSLTNCC